MFTNKLHAGAAFPEIVVKDIDGNEHDLGARSEGYDWKLVVVYRGRHCPMCTRYLNSLQTAKERLAKLGVDLVAVSGDSHEQLEDHMTLLNVDFPVYHGLSVAQMKELGLYISHPRSPEETDHPFAEPGIFVVNEEGGVQVVDISNNPFVRPEIDTLASGLEWIRNPENSYPIRGTYAD